MKKCVLSLLIWITCAFVAAGQSLCSEATTAVAGTNSVPVTSHEAYWYTYTMPSEGKLQITSSSSSSIWVYSDSCEYLQYHAYKYDGNITTTTLKSGDQIFMQWENLSGGGFDWDLSVVPLEAGDNCELAVEAVSGTNSLPASNGQYYWYTYTMPREGKLQISTNTSSYVTVYGSACSDLDSEAGNSLSGYQHVTHANLKAGDRVYIQWELYHSEAFDWDLSVVDFEPGDQCTMAMAAQEDVNTATGRSQWFVYTAPATGDYTISSTESYEAGGYLNIYSDCEENGFASENGSGVVSDQEAAVTPPGSSPETSTEPSSHDETATYLRLTAGQKVYLHWQTYYDADDFHWTLSSAVFEGEKQTITLEALPAKTMQDAPFKLTATASSGLSVSYISTDTSVAKVSGDMVTPIGTGTTTIIAIQGGDSTYGAAPAVEQLLSVVEAPDCSMLMLNIEKIAVNSCEQVTGGSMTVSATGGKAPYRYSLNETAFRDTASFTGLPSGTYRVSVKDAHGCIFTKEADINTSEALAVSGQVSPSTSFSGNGSIALSVTGGLAPYSYTWSHGSTTAYIDLLAPGDFTVTVTDSLGCTSTAVFQVDGLTSVGWLEQPGVAIYPNPARDVLYIDVPAYSSLQKVALYSIIGRKMAEIDLAMDSNQLDIRSIKPGTYLLRFDDGSSRRILVK